MEVCYFALKKMDVGTRTAEIGDLVPEALKWPMLPGYVTEGKLAPIKVSTLYEDEQLALEEWERTGRFNLYQERSNSMAERDMRPTSAVTDEERIDGSDKAVEDKGAPEVVAVDESSDTTSRLVAQIEQEGDTNTGVDTEATTSDSKEDAESKQKKAAEAAQKSAQKSSASKPTQTGADDDEEVPPYDQWTVDDLKEEVQARSLSTTATTKPALVKALEDDDSK